MLVALILSVPIIFAVANANYLPDLEGREEDGAEEEKRLK